MEKAIIGFCLVFLALATAIAIEPSQAAEVTPTVSIDPAALNVTTAYVGQTIQLNLTVSNVNGLWGWAIQDLDFNPAVLNITDVQEGPFLKSKDQTFFLWTYNSTLQFAKGDIPNINCAFAESTTVNGSGVLATITFQVLSAGTSPITIYKSALLGASQTGQINDLGGTWTNGTVTVEAIGSATISPDINSPAPTQVSGSPNPTPQVTSSTSTDPSTSTPEGTNATLSQGSLSGTSSMYLVIVFIVVAVSVVLAVVVFRRRK